MPGRLVFNSDLQPQNGGDEMRRKLFDCGITKKEFVARYFEREIYFRRNAVSESLVTWNAVSAGLYAVDPASANIKLYRDGQTTKVDYLDNYQDGYVVASRFKPGKLSELLSEGSTLVINKLDRYVESVGAVTQEVGEFTSSRTVANAYIAFGGGGTFGKHWDTHCVFALQLRGRKRWRVFRPTFELPLAHQASGKRKDECPVVPIFDEVLEAGDALYIPRGWWHEALPLAGFDTLHVAVGIHTPKIHDYLCWVTSHILTERSDLRRSWLEGELSKGDMNAVLTNFSEAIASVENQRAFLEKHAQLRVGHEAIDFTSILAGITESAQQGKEGVQHAIT